MRSTPTFGRGRPPLESLYLGGGTPSLLDDDAVARIVGLVRERFGLVEDAEVTLEANPGPDERGDPAAWIRAGVTRLSLGAQSMDDTQLRRLGRRHRAVARRGRHRRGTRGRHAVGQPRPALRRARPERLRLDDHAGRGARAGSRPPVAVCADPGRPRGRGAHRPDRRPPADRARRTALARDRPAARRTRTTPRRSTTTRSSGSPRPATTDTRSATGRSPATRAGTTGRTGSAGRTRPSGPARTRSTASAAAGTRPTSSGYIGALTPPDGSAPPPAARRQRAARCGDGRRRAAHPRAPPRHRHPVRGHAARAGRRRRSSGRSPPSSSTSRRTTGSS